MRFLATAPLGCLLLSLGWLACSGGVAWAQSGTLQVPAQKPVESAPKAPSAAPRQPVQQVGPHTGPVNPVPAHPVPGHPASVHPAPVKPPVVQPHGTTHAQKPPAKPTSTAAKPTPTAAKPEAVPVPAAEPAAPAKPADPDKPGAPKPNVPRFASLRFDEVNLRVGPGPRYPIDWLYKRRELPVEIEREFDIWRLIRDPDGTRGWVSQASLTGRRTFIVTGGDATLRRDAADTAAAVAILKPGVIGRIRSCAAEADWCQVQTGDYRGYLKRTQFWGTKPGEAVTP